MKPQSPCLDCDARTEGCHALCQKYKEYKAALDVWNHKVKGAKLKEFVPRKKYTSWEARRYGKGGQR